MVQSSAPNFPPKRGRRAIRRKITASVEMMEPTIGKVLTRVFRLGDLRPQLFIETFLAAANMNSQSCIREEAWGKVSAY